MELFNLYTNFAIHNKLQPVLETTRSYKLPTYTEAVHREPLTSTSVQRVILAFPYNGERVPVARRLAQSPHALYVVSESPYGHNGLLNQMHWHEDFPTHRAEYMRLREKLFNTSSPDSTWSQESMARIILGQGVHNMYARGEISDNDMVVVTDADEVVSPEALAWLQMHRGGGVRVPVVSVDSLLRISAKAGALGCCHRTDAASDTQLGHDTDPAERI